MSVLAKCLINSQFAPATTGNLYAAPANVRTIIDKFTVTNTTASAATLTVHIMPSGGSLGAGNIIVSAQSIAAGALVDFTALQNHILNSGDSIQVLSGTANALTIRANGREVS